MTLQLKGKLPEDALQCLMAQEWGICTCPLRKATVDLGPCAVSSGCCGGLQGGAHKLLVFSHPSPLVTSWWALPRLKPTPFSTQVPHGLHLSLSAIHASPGLQRCHVACPPHVWAICPRTDRLPLNETPLLWEASLSTQTRCPAPGHPSQGLGGMVKVKSCGLP